MITNNSKPQTGKNNTQLLGCRLACAMAIGAFVSFAGIDPFIVDGPTIQFLIYRFWIVVGGLIILGLTWTSFGKRNIDSLSMAMAVWTGCSVILLTELAGGSSSFYWTMIMLTYFTCSVVLHVKTWHALVSFVLVAFFYVFWLTLNDAQGNTADWAISNAGIWLSLILSVVSVRFHNRIREQSLIQHQKLELLNSQLKDEIVERELAQEAYVRSQQLDAVGRLAAGLAHEINNVLMLIGGTAECILLNPENSQRDAQQIVEGVHRGGRLTAGLLQFTRQETRENIIFDLKEVTGQINQVVNRSHRGRVELEYSKEPAPCWVMGDAQLLSQALLNLVLNGIDAMGGSGKLQMDICSKGQMVEVSVSDQGRGMSIEEQNQAIEPFFTTKPPGSGTGLGLSMAYGTVQDHGGNLKIESQLGTGTRVTISIPSSVPNPADVPEVEFEPQLENIAATVILVDDDDMVRETMRMSLQHLGLEVVETASGAEAIKKIQAATGPIDLVVIDMAMPEMDGRETFRGIRDLQPEQAILIYSGFSKNRSVEEMLESGRCRFLRKPFRIRELHNVISQIVPLVDL